MKKSNLILLGILVLNSLLMLALAIVVYSSTSKDSKNDKMEDVLDSIEKTKDKENMGISDENKETLSMYELDTFTVNLADIKATRYARVTIKLELNNFEVEEEIERRTPQIRDLIIVILSSKRFQDIQTTEGKDSLRIEIIKSINTYLVKGEIVNLYFTEFVVN